MNRLLALLLALGSLAACAGHPLSSVEEPETSMPESLFRIDIHPPVDLDFRDDADNLLSLRPQTFYVEAEGSTPVELSLTPAVAITGRVSGFALTPWAPQDLPSREVPVVGATVGLSLPSSIQQPRATTDEDGLFDMLVVPSTEDYELTVAPVSPDLPTYRQRIAVVEPNGELDVLLDPPAPLWGYVRDARGEPMVAAEVYAVGASSLRSASTRTDAEGRYLLAVQPDHSYTVVTTGRGPLDPIVRLEAGMVDNSGLRLDIPAGQLLPRGTLTGTIRGPTGSLVSDTAVRVRVIATELRGLDDATFSFQREIGTDDGIFTAVVPPGSYRVEILPQDLEGPAPLAVTDVRNDGTVVDLGSLNLRPLAQRLVEVLDPEGLPVTNAVIACTEQGFARRTWTGSADPLGELLLPSPEVPVSCVITPPGNRRDLAVTRVNVGESLLEDPLQTWSLSLVEGTVVRGRVSARRSPSPTSTDLEPLPAALVEVRDATDRLIGSGMTSSTGSFELRLAR